MKKPNLGCCMLDNQTNRDIAFSMIDNYFNATGEKHYVVVIDGKLQSRDEVNIVATKILIPNLKVLDHDFC